MPTPIIAAPIRSLLIVKLSSIGDVVQALPVASALKRRFPAMRISWAAESWTADLLARHPAIDRVIVFPRMALAPAATALRSWFAGLGGAVRTLRSERYDVVLDLQGLFKSSMVALLSGGRVRLGIDGQREGSNLFARALPTRAPGRHAVREYLAAAEALGADGEPVDFGLQVKPAARIAVDQLLAPCKLPALPLIVVNASASARRKRWPDACWVELLDLLGDRARVVLVGGRDQGIRHRAIARAARRPPVDLTGRTSLDELVALLARCDLHVAPDTGSAHIAAALRKPVVGIYGPTPAWRLGPYGQADRLVDAGRLCGRSCARFCLYQFRCLRSIPASAVFAKAAMALERGPRESRDHAAPA